MTLAKDDILDQLEQVEEPSAVKFKKPSVRYSPIPKQIVQARLSPQAERLDPKAISTIARTISQASSKVKDMDGVNAMLDKCIGLASI